MCVARWRRREREREREFLFERETEHLWLRQLMRGDGGRVVLRFPFELWSLADIVTVNILIIIIAGRSTGPVVSEQHTVSALLIGGVNILELELLPPQWSDSQRSVSHGPHADGWK